MRVRLLFLLPLLSLFIGFAPTTVFADAGGSGATLQNDCACLDSQGIIAHKQEGSSDCDTGCKNDNYSSGHGWTQADITASAAQAQAALNKTTQAAGTCTCYCGTSGTGAAPVSGTYKSIADCQAACTGLDANFVTCGNGNDVNSSPAENLMCWTQAECAKVSTTSIGGVTVTGTWGTDQPSECMINSHYCYPAPQPVNLAVAIGPVTQVNDIGSYINAFYTYALGAAALIAIVMIMIGGVQYILSGANAEMVGAAKTRMTNAVIGLILLLGAYVILNTVNPYLVKFKSIQPPMLKPSLFLSGGCETYLKESYSVTPADSSKTECGDKGTVSASPNGSSMTTACIYNSCPASDGKNAGCAQVGSTYKCLTCGLATSNAVSLGFNANSGSCASLSPSHAVTDTDKSFCTYITDYDYEKALAGGPFASTATTATLATLATVQPEFAAPIGGAYATYEAYESAVTAYNSKINGSCGLVKINCSSVHKCSDFNNVQIGTDTSDVAPLDDVEGLFTTECQSGASICPVSDGPCDVVGSPGATTFGAGYLTCIPKNEADIINGIIDAASNPLMSIYSSYKSLTK